MIYDLNTLDRNMITGLIFVLAIIAIIIAVLRSASKTERTVDRYPSLIERPENQPYANVYGINYEQGPCAVKVMASSEMSMVVIIRYSNINGKVAGHLYIEKGTSGIIYLPTGIFQTFFYLGRDWDPSKEMDCGLSGGFTNDEIFQEDPRPKDFTKGKMWTYTFRSVLDGNFTPVPADKDLFF